MRRDGKSVAKGNLPEKTCLRCGRPFAWRKKWERDWDQVKFCSDACRRGLSNLKPNSSDLR
ncbi:MAG: DUF2256 domain-containing protein [Verrucomicrobia bacterium]|nr:DUF2256 domain-containing protein [Verrucomicrobiota bacterium]MDA1340330.1 DUF2256 domain-containing protein [Verrucomicrobiota bacterium]